MEIWEWSPVILGVLGLHVLEIQDLTAARMAGEPIVFLILTLGLPISLLSWNIL